MSKPSRKIKPPEECMMIIIHQHRPKWSYNKAGNLRKPSFKLEDNQCLYLGNIESKLDVIWVNRVASFRPMITGSAWIETHWDSKVIRYLGTLSLPTNYVFEPMEHDYEQEEKEEQERKESRRA